MSDGVMEISQIPQICSNEGCQLFNKLADDGTNCMEFDHPQFCPTFASAPAVQVSHNNQQQKPSRAEELVNAHWHGYVGPLLKSCGVAEDLLPMLEFMYKSSGVHFYKHAMEDQHDISRKAMMPRPCKKRELEGAATCDLFNHQSGICHRYGQMYECCACPDYCRKAS